MTRGEAGSWFNTAQDVHHARLQALTQTPAQRQRIAERVRSRSVQGFWRSRRELPELEGAFDQARS